MAARITARRMVGGAIGLVALALAILVAWPRPQPPVPAASSPPASTGTTTIEAIGSPLSGLSIRHVLILIEDFECANSKPYLNGTITSCTRTTQTSAYRVDIVGRGPDDIRLINAVISSSVVKSEFEAEADSFLGDIASVTFGGSASEDAMLWVVATEAGGAQFGSATYEVDTTDADKPTRSLRISEP